MGPINIYEYDVYIYKHIYTRVASLYTYEKERKEKEGDRDWQQIQWGHKQKSIELSKSLRSAEEVLQVVLVSLHMLYLSQVIPSIVSSPNCAYCGLLKCWASI